MATKLWAAAVVVFSLAGCSGSSSSSSSGSTSGGASSSGSTSTGGSTTGSSSSSGSTGSGGSSGSSGSATLSGPLAYPVRTALSRTRRSSDGGHDFSAIGIYLSDLPFRCEDVQEPTDGGLRSLAFPDGGVLPFPLPQEFLSVFATTQDGTDVTPGTYVGSCAVSTQCILVAQLNSTAPDGGSIFFASSDPATTSLTLNHVPPDVADGNVSTQMVLPDGGSGGLLSGPFVAPYCDRL